MNRNQLTRWVFLSYFLILIYKYFGFALLGQQPHPLLYYPGVNLTYWGILLTHIDLFFFKYNALLFMINSLLFVSCLVLIFKPRIYQAAIVFTVSLCIYQLLYYRIISYQPFEIGYLFPCIPFMFKRDLKFRLSFEAGRYFLCGLYGLAAIFKLKNGGLLDLTHMSDSLKITVSDYLLQNPTGIRSEIMLWLISHPLIGYFLYLTVIMLEGSFLIGFFTKKYDWILFVSFLCFHIGNAYLMDLTFTRQFILLFFLLPFIWKKSTDTYYQFQNFKSVSPQH